MSSLSASNRRVAALVALLYVFFSTFGALAHTHASVERAGTAKQTAFALTSPHSSPADCAVCDWQSLVVLPATAPPPVLPPRLFSVPPTLFSSRLPSLPVRHSASRGPPSNA